MHSSRRTFLAASAATGAATLLHPKESAAADASASANLTRPRRSRRTACARHQQLLQPRRHRLHRICSASATSTSFAFGPATAPLEFPSRTAAPTFWPRFSIDLSRPYFVGKDARDLDELLFGVYRQGDNYKYQGLALWCCVALVEFAILDMLGRIAKQPMGALLGGVIRERVPFYVASGRRDTTPEQEIDYLRSLIDETGAKSVKYRVGGRMSRNEDASPGPHRDAHPTHAQSARRRHCHPRRLQQLIRPGARDPRRPHARGHRRRVFRGAVPVRRF